MPHKVPLSLWSELPQAVLAIAFRSLDFFSKLQVGSACKNWGQVLQQTHASIWAISVVIKLYNEGIYVQFETEKESQELVVNQEDCFRAWLSKRIRGICDLHWRRELDLSYEDLLPWEPKFLADILLCIPAPQLPKLSVDIDGMRRPVFQDRFSCLILC